ncbi:MAG: carboxypeptidase regulatory-like domain-containing protein, partial [Bryobacterales bacterium]|nr:carboxypeptidase regulatory-like domain-containing protein [Bryobacterales bacterium]
SIWIARASSHRAESELFHYQTVADAAGKFVKPGIAPGEYRIGYRANGKSSAPQTIRVSAGQQLQLTFP